MSRCTRTLRQQHRRYQRRRRFRFPNASGRLANLLRIRKHRLKCEVNIGSNVTRHPSHVAGHCCVACLHTAGSHGPACQQVTWRSASAAAAPLRAALQPPQAAPVDAGGVLGGEVQLVLECAAALRLGTVGEVTPMQVRTVP